MKPLKTIALIILLFLGSSLKAQLHKSQPSGPLKLQSIPVGDLFNHALPLDMSDDSKDIIWILSANGLYYLVNEGVFEYEIEVDLDADNIHFVHNKADSILRYISRFGITTINGIHSPLGALDLRLALNLDDDRYIRDARYDIDNSLLLIVGNNEARELWRLDQNLENPTLVTKDIQIPHYIHVLEDRVMLSGRGVDVLWREEDSAFRVEQADISHLSPSAQGLLKGIYHDEHYVYLASGDERVFTYELSTDSLSYYHHKDRIEYFWMDNQGDLIILDDFQQILDKDGKLQIDLSTAESFNGEEARIGTVAGSRGFTIGDDLWITSPEGLILINHRKNKFNHTLIQDPVDRVTNVIENEKADRCYVLTSGKGLYIYRLSDGVLIKRIEKDTDGRYVNGFKWQFMDGKLYVYSANGCYNFNLESETLEMLVDPFLVNGQVLPQKLNTLVCNPIYHEVILGTKDNNLIRYNPATKETLLIPVPRPTEKFNLVYEVEVLPDGHILVLTEIGFFHLNMDDNSCRPANEIYPNIPRESLPDLSGLRIVSDSTVVISSLGNGLQIYDLKHDSVYHPFEDAFSNADISDIFYDGKEHVYASSKTGLLSYHVPSNRTRLLTIDVGVKSQNIYYRYMYCESPGEMILGLINGFVRFSSSELTDEETAELLIHSFAINGTKYRSERGLRDAIELNYTQNHLQVTPARTFSQKMSPALYQSRLIGLHDDWRTVPTDRPIRYDALSPGSYRCEIKDINSVGSTYSLDIKIIPPVWKRTWFILLYFGIIAAIVFGIYRIKAEYIRREVELREQYKLEMAQLEMKSLRAQMNPHFLFNSLNSIKSFIAQNEPRIATRYLTKFSHLIRLILNNSREPLLSLEQELKALELYIELEQLRFEHSFDYQITLDPKLDTDNVMLPPLILQPYVENAIWHGLLHKEGERKLTIEIEQVVDGMVVTIRDNGIGREAAKQNRSKTATKRKSLGMAITADRISKVHEGLQSDGIQIRDLVGPEGEALGTEVTIHLPTIND
jgi:two-component sensor histidine kinase